MSTPLGRDTLALVEFSGTEGMSELFQFDITALCDEQFTGPLNFDKALGQDCTVRVLTPDQGERYFCGTLTEAARIGPAKGGALYHLVLRPWFWMLTQRVNSRVFHNMTPEEIIKAVLQKYRPDIDSRTSGRQMQLEYCVQHRESDFAFVSRLLERHGIAYHFEFGNNKQTMVLTDSRSGYGTVPGGTRPYYPDEASVRDEREYLNSWVAKRQFVSGTVALKDYNYLQANADMMAQRQASAGYAHGGLEIYHHPGQFLNQDEGNVYATAARDAVQARDGLFNADGYCIGFSAGLTFTLEKHADAAEYLVLRASHRLVSEEYISGGGDQGEVYRGSYELFRTDRSYAPPQVTPRPFIAGPQIAIVVTDPGDDPENLGRVKVKFHWHKSGSEGDSMWCRVAQVWVGQEWGAQFIPRIGMEALIQFIEGDPDRPVIIGTVPNDSYRLPYSDEANLSGWITRSDNEIQFDDTGGKELVRIYGKRDIEIEAVHQITLKVGSSTIVIDGNSITMKSTNITIEASSTLKTEGKISASHKAGADLTTESGGTATHKASAVVTIQGALVKIN